MMSARPFEARRFLAAARHRWPWVLQSVAVSLVGALMGVGWLAGFEIPDLAPQAESSQVLAADGALIATLHGEEDRTVVPLSQISPILQTAVLLSEDRDFFDHGGMSLKGITRAAFTNLAGGGIRQGGSTITQQYARNAFPEIGRDRTLVRKLKESFLSIHLETGLTKKEILERYLNTVYFGRGAYGVEAAARTYFKVPAGEVTHGQAAYLAGVIRAPERFQINENLRPATDLRNRVIDTLVDAEAITADEGRAAKQEKLEEQLKIRSSIEVESPRAGYFVEYVRRSLKDQFGLTDDQILRGGLTIQTTLDLHMQNAAEAAIRDVLGQPDDPEAALIAMGPQGEIRAMVGGRDVDSVERARGFNFSIDQSGKGGGRQAGSAFKPIALAAFLAKGNSLSSTFSGPSPMEITSGRCRNQDGTPWRVSNFEGRSFGDMDLTAATLSSVNTVYAQIMDRVVTPNEFIATAERVGIHVPAFDRGCALTLGTSDATPLEMARAYTTFARRGTRPDPISVLRITSPGGEVLAEVAPNTEPGLDRNVADTINYVLERNIRSGTGSRASIGRPAAGKTGTTQNHQNAWFAGYTPELTAVVWVGYAPGPDGTIAEMKAVRGVEVTGGSFPATIWRRFMAEAVKGLPETAFNRPVLDGVALNYGQSNPTEGQSQPEASPSASPSPTEPGGPVGATPAPPGPPAPGPGSAPSPSPSPSPPPAPLPSPAISPTAGAGFKPCFPFC